MIKFRKDQAARELLILK